MSNIDIKKTKNEEWESTERKHGSVHAPRVLTGTDMSGNTSYSSITIFLFLFLYIFKNRFNSSKGNFMQQYLGELYRSSSMRVGDGENIVSMTSIFRRLLLYRGHMDDGFYEAIPFCLPCRLYFLFLCSRCVRENIINEFIIRLGD